MKRIYEIVPYETWCLWMVKANFKQALKDYGIKWYTCHPLRCRFNNGDEFTISEFLWNLAQMPLGERLKYIKENLELSKKYRD